MAGMPATSREFECPVCREDYAEPKMLPCTHLACRRCVLSLLTKAEDQGASCPVCKGPILLPSPQVQTPEDLTTQVDGLPTDMATVALVEGHKVLRGQHVCKVCENGVPAVSFCLQCDAKLCKTCSKGHNKLPALKNHVIEELSKLTAQRLAAHHLSICKSHDDRPAELYCSAHLELICMLCASTNHRGCVEVKDTTEMAKEKRLELTQQAQRLREKESTLTAQIRDVKDRFKAARKKVKDTFDDLQQCVKKRRLEANSLIQMEEDTIMAALTQMERNRSAVKANANTVEHLVNDAPDVALLDMLGKLTSRLSQLELQTGAAEKINTVVEVNFDQQRLGHLKSTIGVLGRITAKTKGRQTHSASKVNSGTGPTGTV